MVVAWAAPARAQSVRYPPDAPDADQDAAAHSGLWESALEPARAPYEAALRDARHALDEQGDKSAQTAVDMLTDAIHRLPDDPRAFALRGEAFLALHDWARCADDFAVAIAKPPAPSAAPGVVARDRDRHELDLGICQGRAGHYAEAEQTLIHNALRAPRGETWLRLGEVRIALGKLDEAITALDAALDSADGATIATHWLLASAYDRARRPTLAEAEGTLALSRDITLSALVNPTYPWLGRGEGDYLMGLAYLQTAAGASAMPEYALLYFRHFLANAPDSPWRRRVQEHVRALEALALPAVVTRDSSSTAVVDLAAIRPLLERAMPALRACAGKQANAAYAVSIVKTGPKSDAADLAFRPRYAVQPAGARAELRLDIGEPTAATTADATRACLLPLAERIPLPAPKDHDTWYRVSFLVIGVPIAAPKP